MIDQWSGGVATVDPKAFDNSIPDGQFEGSHKDAFDFVDNHRSKFAADVSNEFIDTAAEYVQREQAPATLSEFGMGGNTTFDASLSAGADDKLCFVGCTRTVMDDALGDIYEKAGNLSATVTSEDEAA